MIIAATASLATVAVKYTTALLSDNEVSAGNNFAAGAIDLKIDNHSYYNGALSPSTTWELADLDDGKGPSGEGKYLFFNFHDLKPGDWGEDTISVHVKDNDAWACTLIQLTTDDDTSSTEPELSDGDATDTADLWDGELAHNLNFIFWADDGDNVLEDGERLFFNDPTSLDDLTKLGLAGTHTAGLVLAQSNYNAFTGAANQPLTGGQDYYIGKAWCFGKMTLQPVPAGNNNNPTINPGIKCDGAGLNNLTQTDSITGNVIFTALQSRHVPSYRCPGTL